MLADTRESFKNVLNFFLKPVFKAVNTPRKSLIYQFEDFRLDPQKQRLVHGVDLLPLTPKAVETLRVLIERRGQIVERDELMTAVWPDVAVEDQNLSVTVSMLRKVLAEYSDHKFIETFPKRGYKFIGDIKELHESGVSIVVEKQTVGRVVIDEQLSPSFKGLLSTTRRKVAAATTATLALLLATGAFVYSSRSNRSATSTAAVRSIAILPFKALNATDANDHQGLGLADILITRLSNIDELSVRPTSAILSYENSEESSTAVGKKLSVDAVLEGSILRVNDRVRVTARLLRTSDQSPIWAAQFEKSANDELQLQNEIALQLVDALSLHLTGKEEQALTKRYTQSADAYQLYLKGRYHWNKRDYGSLSEAERLFRNAIEKDPKFALAYVGLADSLIFYSMSTELNAALAKAIELDPNLAEAQASYGFMLAIHEWRWKDAEDAFKKSIDLNPGYATAHHWYGILLGIQGRHDEAKAEIKRALEIDPLSYNFLADLGQVYYFKREYETAEGLCKKSLEIYPEFPFAHQYLSSIYRELGKDEQFIEEFVKAINYNVQSANDTAALSAARKSNLQHYAELYRAGGLKKFYEYQLSQSNNPSLSSPNRAFGDATYYTLMGDKEKALTELEKAFETRSFLMAWLKADPVFDSLRAEPRFKAILQKMGLPPDA